MAEDIKDTTKEDVTDKTGDDDTSSSIDPGEFEKAKESAKALSDLLEDHGFDSKEDLVEALSSGKDLKDQLGETELKDILEKAKTLDSYEQYWAAQDAKKKDDDEEDEDSDGTKALKKVTAWEKSRQEEELRRSAVDESEKVLHTFSTEVKGMLEKNEAIPEEYRPFVAEFLGVDNPANEIDLEKPTEVRKMIKEGIKKIQDFEQTVIKRYREGKLEVPDMTKTEPLDVDQVKEKKPKNIAEAKKIAAEILNKQFFGKA